MNIGILGGGNISGTHARAAAAIPGVKLVAFHGSNHDRTAKLAEPYGAAGEPLPWWGGVGAAILSATLAPMVAALSIEPLTDPLLWGRAVDDERYAALARLA